MPFEGTAAAAAAAAYSLLTLMYLKLCGRCKPKLFVGRFLRPRVLSLSGVEHCAEPTRVLEPEERSGFADDDTTLWVGPLTDSLEMVVVSG